MGKHDYDYHQTISRNNEGTTNKPARAGHLCGALRVVARLALRLYRDAGSDCVAGDSHALPPGAGAAGIFCVAISNSEQCARAEVSLGADSPRRNEAGGRHRTNYSVSLGALGFAEQMAASLPRPTPTDHFPRHRAQDATDLLALTHFRYRALLVVWRGAAAGCNPFVDRSCRAECA